MATAQTPPSQAQVAQQAIANFLTVAPSKYISILGSVAAGNGGGNTAVVTWNSPIPVMPAFCTAVDYTITLPVSVTLPATTGTATLSPFAPYSGVGNQITLGGAPPWAMTEFTPWYLDGITRGINQDPAYPGLGNEVGWFSTTLDEGPSAIQIGGSGSLNPGQTVTNTTASPVTTDYTFTFKLRQQLQRKRHLLSGAIPFGDPQNRPDNITQIFPLLGSLPEQNLFVAGDSGATVTLTSAATVNATYELSYIDLLPPAVTTTPQPRVGYGLQLTQFSTSGLNAGTIYPITHRTAMLYTGIHHILVNNQLPIRSDYFGLWDNQDQQSARWAFDEQNNTFIEWFTNVKRIYRRYFPTGHYFVDMDGGEFPEIPSVTPLVKLMSPDQIYANDFGIPVTPAMSTAIRIPSGTSVSSPYVRSYSFGLVKVPY